MKTNYPLNYKQVDDLAQTGDPLVDIEVEDSTTTSTMEVQESEAIHIGKSSAPDPESGVPDRKGSGVLATPAVRRMAAQHNINLAEVSGSGKDGRVMKEDILNYLDGQSQGKPAKQQVEQPSAPVVKEKTPEKPKIRVQPSNVKREDSEKPFSPFVRAMTKSMTAALQIPHFGYKDEIDMTELVDLRSKVKKDVEKDYGVKLSYMPFMVKAASLALKEFPVLNSSVDLDREKVIYKVKFETF